MFSEEMRPMIRCKRSLRSICNLQHDGLPSLWFDRNLQAPFATRAEKFVCLEDLIELETVCEQRQWIEAFRLHHRHQPAHPFFPARAKRGHDFVITNARGKPIVRHLKFTRINAEAAQGPARTQ